MTHALRLVAVAALATIMLSGCGKGPSTDDGPVRPAADPHAGHDHGPAVTDAHADDGHDDGHDGHDHSLDDGHDDGHDGHDHSLDDGHDDGHDDANDDEHDGESAAVIQIDEKVLAEFGIRLAIAESGVLSDVTSLAGEVVLNPDRVAHVVARAGGIGTEVPRAVGDRVEAGDSLAVLVSAELAESKAAYLSRAAEAALAAIDLARAETIYENTNRLLEIIGNTPDVDSLRGEISGLDIGASRGQLITAYAELQAAEAVYDREKTLFERQISSESEYLRADSELKKALVTFQAVRDDLAFANRRELDATRRSKVVADVSRQAAERRLHAFGLDESEVNAVATESDVNLARYEIRAPIGGRIIERHLVRGESLEAGEQVFVIADLSSVWGKLTLYQRDLAVVREGQPARVFATHGAGRNTATIEYVSPILDEQTRTTTARVVLDNADGNWRPGMFIRAELAAPEQHASVIVPRTAVNAIDGEMVMFVRTAKGLERREVKLGRNDSESVEIRTGLRPGERYVVSGGLALKAELNKAALEHAGHAH